MEKIVSRFRGKLVKKTKVVSCKFDDYSIPPKIRHILLNWGYELTIKDFFNELSNQRINMNYYWLNRQEIQQKAKDRYSKEKAAQYYAQNKEAIKERYTNFSQEEKDKIKEYQRKNIKNWFSIKKSVKE